jgi:hypothetical protein
VDWILLAQNRVQWRAFENIIMKLRVPQKWVFPEADEELSAFQEEVSCMELV